MLLIHLHSAKKALKEKMNANVNTVERVGVKCNRFIFLDQNGNKREAGFSSQTGKVIGFN